MLNILNDSPLESFTADEAKELVGSGFAYSSDVTEKILKKIPTDGFYNKDDHKLKSRDQLDAHLQAWKPEGFSILLSHRPEYFDVYASHAIDISFSGHVHGGQIRFPFIGAILAPHQGFFPKYSTGMYQINTSRLFLSRGLGNSLFPFRIFNHPELILVSLESNCSNDV